MTNNIRDPKTGRFVKKFLENHPSDFSLEDMGKYWESIHKQEKGWEKAYGIKTPRNYWNYILLGVFGIICAIIGYELTQLFPIL